MAGLAADSATSSLQKMLEDGAALSPALDVAGAVVRNSCGEMARVAVGSYQRDGASSKTAAVNPPVVRWGYASITKTVVGVVMQMLMANESLPSISWNDKLHQWLPLALGTAYENASLLDVASHTACLTAAGAPLSDQLLLEHWQQLQVGGYPAARAVWVNNSLHHPTAPSGCIPELNTEATYVHVDGVQILALIEETISGSDFATLAKSLIFEPLGMTSAEVVDANPAGGLRASLSDLGLYGQWLVDGYNNQPDAIARTLLKHQDFVDLMSPITKHGVEQGVGRTFSISSYYGRHMVSHGGCLGASLNLWPEDDLVTVLAVTPEDADWATCDVTEHFLPLIWSTAMSIADTFTACNQRPYHLCTDPVSGTSLTCSRSDDWPLDSSTIDSPYPATSCREEDLAVAVKESLSLYLATAPDLWSKAFVVVDSCQWAIAYYMLDPCQSVQESFKICEHHKVQCGVYLLGNSTYNPINFPCRCGTWVSGTCSLSNCPSNRSTEIDTTCLIADAGASDASSSTSSTSTSSTSSTSSTGRDGLASKSRLAVGLTANATAAALLAMLFLECF